MNNKSKIFFFSFLLCLPFWVGAQESVDSIPLTEEVELEEFELDTQSVNFIPKGQWVTGVSVNFSQSNQNNYEFLIFEKITGDTYSFKVSPMFCYIFKDDMGVGGKFGYSRSLTKLENADVVLDSETDYSMDHLYSLSHSYYAMAIFRNYFSLGKSKRFGFFNEAQIEVGGGQSKLASGTGSDIIGSYSRTLRLNVGFSPGMVVFLNNYSALEVNVGVLGFTYTDIKQTSNQIHVSHTKSKMANFKINIFSISFGMAFYL